MATQQTTNPFTCCRIVCCSPWFWLAKWLFLNTGQGWSWICSSDCLLSTWWRSSISMSINIVYIFTSFSNNVSHCIISRFPSRRYQNIGSISNTQRRSSMRWGFWQKPPSHYRLHTRARGLWLCTADWPIRGQSSDQRPIRGRGADSRGLVWGCWPGTQQVCYSAQPTDTESQELGLLWCLGTLLKLCNYLLDMRLSQNFFETSRLGKLTLHIFVFGCGGLVPL